MDSPVNASYSLKTKYPRLNTEVAISFATQKMADSQLQTARASQLLASYSWLHE